jgi:hypothetical protein
VILKYELSVHFDQLLTDFQRVIALTKEWQVITYTMARNWLYEYVTEIFKFLKLISQISYLLINQLIMRSPILVGTIIQSVSTKMLYAYRRHIKILGTRRMTQSKGQTNQLTDWRTD